jgi:hypothetical protein
MASIGSSPFPPMRLPANSPTVNNPGKPDAGNPPVRFDEGREPIRRLARWTAPAYSTLCPLNLRELFHPDLVGAAPILRDSVPSSFILHPSSFPPNLRPPVFLCENLR